MFSTVFGANAAAAAADVHDLNRVRAADAHARNRVAAVGARRRFVARARRLVYGDDAGARDRLLLRAGDDAADAAGRHALRGEPGGQRCGAKRENRERENQESCGLNS